MERLVEKKFEKGENVELTLHIIRHGDRNPDGTLEEYGRKRTKEKAQSYHSKHKNFDIVKAYGSTAGPKTEVEGEGEMQRSLETAHIFGKEVAGEELYQTRPRDILNYEEMELEMPFDYLETHGSFANEYIHNILKYKNKSFDDLSIEERKEVSEYADRKSVEYLMNLRTKEAEDKRKETAGSFAVLIQKYVKMIQKKLKSNQKFLFLLGSHTGMLEPFLAETVIWEDEDGKQKQGATLEEMGGNFNPSEGFDIILKTGENGKFIQPEIYFDDKTRFGGNKVYLDMQKIDEFAEFYSELQEGIG